jgi:hypothetical protein
MLKEEILKQMRVELPISGGYGKTLEDAIVIHHTLEHNLYDVEDTVRQYLFNRYCVSQQLIRQELISKGERVYDRFHYDCIYVPDKPDSIRLEVIHFDITDCWK